MEEGWGTMISVETGSMTTEVCLEIVGAAVRARDLTTGLKIAFPFSKSTP